MIKLVFKGAPIAKKRHRTTKAGHAYNAQSGVEAGIRVAAEAQYQGEPLEGPVVMNIRAVFPRPKSHFGTGRNSEKLKPSSPRYHTNKIDADNLVKFYSDCLNGITYLDDAQVVEIWAKKIWSDDPKATGITEVTISEVMF